LRVSVTCVGGKEMEEKEEQESKRKAREPAITS
jgi:hypothetical protein